jgi:hypothetical protein
MVNKVVSGFLIVLTPLLIMAEAIDWHIQSKYYYWNGPERVNLKIDSVSVM